MEQNNSLFTCLLVRPACWGHSVTAAGKRKTKTMAWDGNVKSIKHAILIVCSDLRVFSSRPPTCLWRVDAADSVKEPELWFRPRRLQPAPACLSLSLRLNQTHSYCLVFTHKVSQTLNLSSSQAVCLVRSRPRCDWPFICSRPSNSQATPAPR